MILGILGGIGSGKSTVTRCLVDEGADHVDADAIAHEVLESDGVHTALRAWMGDSVFGVDGSVDREAVGRQVFGSAEKLKRLESLTHPIIRSRLERDVEKFRRSPGAERRILVLDIPLLAGSPLSKLCEEFVFVDASLATRRSRTSARGWDDEELSRREAHQRSLEEKRKMARYVISNDESLDATRNQVKALYHRVLENSSGRGKFEETTSPCGSELL